MAFNLLTNAPTGTAQACSNSDGTVMLAAAGKTIHRSVDSGATWAPIYTNPIGTSWAYSSIEQSPDGQYILAVGSFGQTNFQWSLSSDYGASFTTTSAYSQTAGDCAISNDGQTLAYAIGGNSPTQGYLFWSTNGGSSWSNQGTGDVDPGAHQVAMDASGQVIMYSYKTVHQGYRWTTNGGSSWTAYNPGTSLGFLGGVACSADGQVMVAVWDGSGTNRFRISTNGGSSWVFSDGPSAGGQFGQVEISADGQTIIVAGIPTATPSIWRSINQGSSWEDLGWSGSQMSEPGLDLSSNGSVLSAVTLSTGLVYRNDLSTPLALNVEDINAQSSLGSLGFVPPLSIEPISAQSWLSTASIFSNPVVVNRVPYPGTIVGVADPVAFSVRDQDRSIVRSSLNCHIGAGPAFWEGGVLPEDDPLVEFILKARVGKPGNPATRTLLGNGAVQIEKVAANQEAIYEWGKLQSPADPEDPIMVEFTLELPQATLNTDSNDYTGVLVGLNIGDTGVAIKFFTDGVDQRTIEIHDINNSATSPPSSTYIAAYDWDQGIPHTYKLLWHPLFDLVRLYVSVGQESIETDILLIDGNVSDFPSSLPADEIPPVQPVAFFGHGLATTYSTSIWHNAYLYNLVNSVLRSGFLVGEQTGFLRTDEVTDYRIDALPRKAERPWLSLPESFGDVGGNSFVTTDRRLQIFRQELTDSYGYYRIEPKVDQFKTIFDFRIAGRTISLDPATGVATGMEIYIDDGTRKAVVALLDDLGTQYIGLLNDSAFPTLLNSYDALLASWLNEVNYRMYFDPAGSVIFKRFVLTDDGWDEETIATIAYGDLPASDLPGPGLGFLHNANIVEALAELRVAQMRYSTDVQTLNGASLPTAQGWTKSATSQVATTDGTELTIEDTSATEALYYYKSEPDLDETRGFTAEFRARIDSYEKGGLVNPIRELTGVGVEIDDAGGASGGIYRLMFADVGPGIENAGDGKILFFGANDDVEQNLLDIRAGLGYVQGTYVEVDWTVSHVYRIEKTIGGTLRVYVDFDDTPSLEFDVPISDLPATSSGPEIRFGNLLTAWKSTSVWKWLNHNLSAGYDISSFTLTSENEVLSRFSHAINVIVEAVS